MPFSHVGTLGSNPTNSEDTFLRLTAPAGTQAGHLMVAAVACETESFANPAISAPAGWTRVALREQTVGSNGPVLALFYKLATSSDIGGSTTYDFTWAHTATGRVGTISTYRGVHRSTPFDKVATPMAIFAGTDIYAGEADGVPAAAAELMVAAYLINYSAARTFTPNSATTERYDQTGNGTGGDDYLSLALADTFNAELTNNQYPATASSGTYTAAIGTRALFKPNPSPNAPTPPPPSNFTSSEAQTWIHNFSDDMAGDEQTARQWRVYRVSDGALVHDTGKVATASLEYVLAANTLANGSQYQRQVRVWDVDDNESQWSLLQSFYVSAPPVADVTSPTPAQVVEASTLDVVIDYTDPEAEPKSAYRVVVLRTDVAETLLDTGKVLSADDPQIHRVSGLSDGGSYTVRAYVWDQRGIVSAVDEVSFTVDYAEPPQPSVLVADGGHFLRLGITNPAPTGTEVVAAYNDISRREVGGAWTRIVAGLDVNESYDDHAVASGTVYEYKVTAYTGTGGARDSEVASGSVTLEQTWFHDPAAPSTTSWGTRNRRLKRTATKDFEVSMLRLEGRTHPVAEFGDALSEKVTFDVLMFDDSTDLETWRALVDRKATLCYRDGRGRKVFGTVTNLTEDDHRIGAEVPIQVTATHYSEEV